MRQDYVNARFLEWWSYHPRLLKDDIFPGWMKFECKIGDPVSKTRQMIEEGYLREGTFEEQLSRLSVSELKDIVTSQNLPKGKKKQDFIDIIINQGAKEKISLPPVFTISDKGISYLDEHKNMIAKDASFIEEYVIRDASGDIIDINYDKYGLDFEINTGAFTTINKTAIKYIIQTEFHSQYFSEIGIEFNDSNVKHLKETFLWGELRGFGYNIMGKALSETIGIDEQKATLLISTESSYFHTERELKDLQRAGFKQFEFMAAHADDNCEICRSLDKKVFSISDAAIGKNCPPMHMGCRCIITTPQQTAADIQHEINERVESWNIPEGMSFDEFVDRANNGELEKIREEQRATAATITCPSCASVLDANTIVRFCPKCGAQIK